MRSPLSHDLTTLTPSVRFTRYASQRPSFGPVRLAFAPSHRDGTARPSFNP
jgi:hypothetical protein